MKQRVYLLEYIDDTKDTLILGCFCDSIINETIEYYKKLTGFSSCDGEFVCSEELYTNKNTIFLLQIWRDIDEIVVLKKMYKSYNDAQNALESYIVCSNEEHFDSSIDKYDINKKMWTEGFIR